MQTHTHIYPNARLIVVGTSRQKGNTVTVISQSRPSVFWNCQLPTGEQIRLRNTSLAPASPKLTKAEMFDIDQYAACGIIAPDSKQSYTTKGGLTPIKIDSPNRRRVG